MIAYLHIDITITILNKQLSEILVEERLKVLNYLSTKMY